MNETRKGRRMYLMLREWQNNTISSDWKKKIKQSCEIIFSKPKHFLGAPEYFQGSFWTWWSRWGEGMFLAFHDHHSEEHQSLILISYNHWYRIFSLQSNKFLHSCVLGQVQWLIVLSHNLVVTFKRSLLKTLCFFFRKYLSNWKIVQPCLTSQNFNQVRY